jgi:hypothetical protein
LVSVPLRKVECEPKRVTGQVIGQQALEAGVGWVWEGWTGGD